MTYKLHRWRVFWLFILVVVVLAGGGIGGLLWALRTIRPFYRSALLIPKQNLDQGSLDFLNRLSKFKNDLRKLGQWSLVLTDEQINGWLAVDLPRNHPDALPEGIYDPRVAVTSGQVSAGVTVDRQPFPVVASLDANIQLERENQISVRILTVRLGNLPWTLEQVVTKLIASAQDQGWTVQQTVVDNTPVLIFTMPERQSGEPYQIIIESLELRDGALYVAGRTEPVAADLPPKESVPAAGQPTGPLAQ
ncbi:MAG: hypothetical protein SFX18_19165 [Pirellulales bacterium]|nr:hypothetical protein [Pirellulales bacterium]